MRENKVASVGRMYETLACLCFYETVAWSLQEKNSAVSCCLLAGLFLFFMELIDYLNIYLSKYAGKTYEITIDTGEVFTLCFDIQNFPHIFGVHYCYPKEHKNLYSGMNGVNLIQSGVVTFEKMKQANLKEYDRKVSRKTDAFDLFTDLFPSKIALLEVVVFDKTRVINLLDRELDNVKLIISSKQNSLIKFIFMFGKRNDSTPNFYPISFRKELSNNLDYYDLQTKHSITSIQEL